MLSQGDDGEEELHQIWHEENDLPAGISSYMFNTEKS